MLYISESKDGTEVINLTRGDDAVIDVPMENADGETYTIGETEYLIFAVRKIPNKNSELLVQIESNRGSNQIVFDHEDTKDIAVGEYSAEIQLMTVDGKRITVWPTPIGKYATSESINRKNFILMPEVVYE